MPPEYKLFGPFHITHTLNSLNKYEWHLYKSLDKAKNKDVNEKIKNFGIFVGAIQEFESKMGHYHIPFIKSKKEFTEFNNAISFLVKSNKKKLNKKSK